MILLGYRGGSGVFVGGSLNWRR